MEKIATFELDADRDTIADNYETDINIIWLDGDERLETTESFALVVVSREGSNTGFMTIAAVAVILIVVILGVFIYFKSKKRKGE